MILVAPPALQVSSPSLSLAVIGAFPPKLTPALELLQGIWLNTLTQHPDLNLADVAHTPN